MRLGVNSFLSAVLLSLLFTATSRAVDKNFHDAPDSAKTQKNPYEGQQDAVDAGKPLYARNCLACHGKAGKGTGNIPSLVDGKLKGVPQGEVFWFVTQGDQADGMPSWAALPEKTRWQIVTYVEAMAAGTAGPAATAAPAASSTAAPIKNAAPQAPFTDFRYEAPGTIRKITVNDLPQPYASKSSDNGPDVVARPANAWPIAPPGFKVEQYFTGLENPRILAAPFTFDINPAWQIDDMTGVNQPFGRYHGLQREGKDQVLADGSSEEEPHPLQRGTDCHFPAESRGIRLSRKHR